MRLLDVKKFEKANLNIQIGGSVLQSPEDTRVQSPILTGTMHASPRNDRQEFPSLLEND